MYSKIEIARRLKGLRKQKGKTQIEVSKDTKLSIDTISKIERGIRYPSIESLDIFREYYDSSIDYILFGKEEVKLFEDYILKEKNYFMERIACKLKSLM